MTEPVIALIGVSSRFDEGSAALHDMPLTYQTPASALRCVEEEVAR
jgi:hypothetical protein